MVRASPPPVSPQRLTALADGVFAIAMTLLVLELAIPVVAEDALAGALAEMWPEFTMYALSFLVLGVYWLIHHMIYDSIIRYDTTLAWLNTVYLLFAALVPFSTALVVEYGAVTATAITYGINMLLLFGMGWGMWTYATGKHRLVSEDADEELGRGGRLMGIIYATLLAAALAIAFISPLVSMLIYAGIVVAFIVFTVAGKWEAVTIWRSPRAAPSRHASDTA